jgi:hypothetical protein
MPSGKLNAAEVPVPSVSTPLPLPASVCTKPVAHATIRTRWLLQSATNSTPRAGYTPPPDTKTAPTGLLNAAFVPTPFAKVAMPLPASDVTMRVTVFTARTRAFPASTTYSAASSPTATLRMPLNPALVPTPFAKPGVAPARVPTTQPPGDADAVSEGVVVGVEEGVAVGDVEGEAPGERDAVRVGVGVAEGHVMRRIR